jgi:hypothetical protein
MSANRHKARPCLPFAKSRRSGSRRVVGVLGERRAALQPLDDVAHDGRKLRHPHAGDDGRGKNLDLDHGYLRAMVGQLWS